MGLISVQEQLALFVGLVYLPARNRVRMPDGSLVDQKRFNVIFPGQYDSGGKSTKAWFAFVHNQAYRPPVDTTPPMSFK